MFQFKVKWWCDNTEHTNCGIVCGRTYREAIDALVDYFGENEMTQCKLTPIGEGDNILIYKDGFEDISAYLEA